MEYRVGTHCPVLNKHLSTPETFLLYVEYGDVRAWAESFSTGKVRRNEPSRSGANKCGKKALCRDYKRFKLPPGKAASLR
jgi:hypothetical protein